MNAIAPSDLAEFARRFGNIVDRGFVKSFLGENLSSGFENSGTPEFRHDILLRFNDGTHTNLH